MAELPSSWNLKTRKRDDGKLDIIGKDDLGSEYKVRTTQTSAVTDLDVREIASTDRERTTAREFVKGVIDNQRQLQKVREDEMDNEYNSVAEDIVGQCVTDGRATQPGQIDVALKCGLASSYARGERYWREIEEWRRQGCPLPILE